MLTHPLARRIKHWALNKLIPFARNPRTHSDAQVAQIAASITEYGWTVPILIDARGRIIAGYGRYLAALLSQRSIDEAARACGVGARTLLRWLKLPEFNAAYRRSL